MKPKNCIYPDCLNCTLDDCLYNTLEQSDIVQQNKFDKDIAFENKLEHLEPKQRAKAIYDRKYEQTEKGKAAQKRYKQSEKGKAAQKRREAKRIETGKNAIYCKRYREKKKREAMLNEQVGTTKISRTNDESSAKQAEE